MAQAKCHYCGFTEKELCSALVVGQSRHEHDAYLSCCKPAVVHDYFENQRNTEVNFFHEGEHITAPAIDYAFFPRASYKFGKGLHKLYEQFGQEPITVHDLCAAQMFHARVNHLRHTLRRRRKAVGLRAISMCGISIQPLGYDDQDFEYWKFPFSSDLFICYRNGVKPYDIDKDEFNRLIQSIKTNGKVLENGPELLSKAESSTDKKVWVRINDVEVIKTIVACLGASYKEEWLKKNLITEVLADRMHSVAKGTSSMPEKSAAVSTSNNATQSPTDDAAEIDEMDIEELDPKNNRNRSSESNPCVMGLYANKGQDILDAYHIQEEKVFEDDGDKVYDEDEDEDESSQYFSFSKGRR
jgi:hypothetical protein